MKNCEALASYLAGFRAATGKYLVMLDGDDILLPNILNSITDSSLLGLDVCMRMGMAPLNSDTDYREFKVEKVAKKFAFIPGYLFAVTQNTGGTAYIFPKSIFEKSDTEWEQISIQDRILPGILSFYCMKFVKLKTVGYKFEPNYSKNSLGQQTHRKNCERVLSDLQIWKRAQELKVNLVAQKLLKIAAFVRVRKYIKKYSIQLPDLSLRLCFEDNEIFHNVCRNVALAIISQR
jgi:glycosyltransferase involved in cell wall biosynthesis